MALRSTHAAKMQQLADEGNDDVCRPALKIETGKTRGPVDVRGHPGNRFVSDSEKLDPAIDLTTSEVGQLVAII